MKYIVIMLLNKVYSKKRNAKKPSPNLTS